MNDRHVPTDRNDDNEAPFIYVSQLMFGKLCDVGVSLPNCIEVMLTIAANIDPDGCIEISLAEVEQRCKIPLKKIKATILGLAGGELIESLSLSALAAGTVSCQVSSDLIRYGKPRASSFPLGTPTKAE